MSAHTPGPWQILLDLDGVFITSANGGRAIARIPPLATNAKPDANLIAAAPDLLEALKACAAVCAGETMNKNGLIGALEMAHAAIKKATGGGQ